MQTPTKILPLAIVILSGVVFGTVLKPDRVISVTSLEHRGGTPGKSYRVDAKSWEGTSTAREPTLYYQLACGTGAADLAVGHVYEATEGTTEGVKVLFIGLKVEDDVRVIMCEVESVKSTSK